MFLHESSSLTSCLATFSSLSRLSFLIGDTLAGSNALPLHDAPNFRLLVLYELVSRETITLAAAELAWKHDHFLLHQLSCSRLIDGPAKQHCDAGDCMEHFNGSS